MSKTKEFEVKAGYRLFVLENKGKFYMLWGHKDFPLLEKVYWKNAWFNTDDKILLPGGNLIVAEVIITTVAQMFGVGFKNITNEHPCAALAIEFRNYPNKK